MTRAHAEGETPPGQAPGESKGRGQLLSAPPIPPGCRGSRGIHRRPGRGWHWRQTSCLPEGDLGVCENSAEGDDGIHHNVEGKGSK